MAEEPPASLAAPVVEAGAVAASEPTVETPEAAVVESPEAAAEAAAAPKRRGRPPGSKDTVKRVRRPPITVRIDPILPAEPEPPTPRNVDAKARRPARVPPPAAEVPFDDSEEQEPPPTPRSMLRAASRHFVALKTLVQDSRQQEVRSVYTRKLMAWPS